MGPSQPQAALPQVVLIVDDELLLARRLARALRGSVSRRIVVHSLEQAEELLGREDVDAVFVDQHLGGGERGSDFLARLATSRPGVRRVLMTDALGTGRVAAHVAITKPFSVETALSALRAK